MNKWPGQLDPRDYRAKEKGEEYEGPLFHQMMKGEVPEPLEVPTGMQGKQYNPRQHNKRSLYERS